MFRTKFLKSLLAVSSITLFACSANNSSVKTTTSPVDGKTRTVIQGSDFSTSYIYPIEGSSMLGMEIAGGSVTNKETASIVLKVSSDSGFRKAYFKADGDKVDLHPTQAITDFNSNEYGVTATKEFTIGCENLKRVSQSKEVYLRVTFADGYVDYDVSKAKFGADGFGMIKKIAQYCG